MVHKKTDKNGVAIAASVTAAIAAVAGAYFLYGTKEGKKAKKKIRGWALKAKGEVLEKIEKMKDLSEGSYNTTVANVMDKYKKVMKDHGDEVEIVKKELLGYWNHLKKHLNENSTKAKKKVSNK